MYCDENGIKRQLSSPNSFEKNGIVERRNESVAKAVRAMLFENDVPKTFWREVVNTIVYTLNKVQIRKGMGKIPYELWFGYSQSVKYFRIFGSKCYIKRNDDIGKFHPRSDECMFLGYSLKSKAFKCFNYRTKTIVECANERIDEKFGTKEKMIDYNSDEDYDNSRLI